MATNRFIAILGLSMVFGLAANMIAAWVCAAFWLPAFIDVTKQSSNWTWEFDDARVNGRRVRALRTDVGPSSIWRWEVGSKPRMASPSKSHWPSGFPDWCLSDVRAVMDRSQCADWVLGYSSGWPFQSMRWTHHRYADSTAFLDRSAPFPEWAFPFHVLWPETLANLAFYAVLAYPAALLLTNSIRGRRVAAGFCPTCKYDIRTQDSRWCPECGWCAQTPTALQRVESAT